MIQLTEEECKSVYTMIEMLSGSNPEYVFAQFSCGEADDPEDPSARAFAKIYKAAGQEIPDNLEGVASSEVP